MSDRDIREAEKAGDWQRLYAMLRRTGRFDEAEQVMMDHPITVDCTVQYVYTIDFYNGEEHFTNCMENPSLNELIREYLDMNLSSYAILNVTRIPTYTVMGKRLVDRGWHRSEALNGPLVSIRFSKSEVDGIRQMVRQHPDYLKNATIEQHLNAQYHDDQAAARIQREIKQEKDEQQRQAAKREREARFNDFNRQVRGEVWKLWEQHHHLARPDFAEAIRHHLLRYILFRLKDMQEHGEIVDWDKFRSLWNTEEPRRRNIWRRHNPATAIY